MPVNFWRPEKNKMLSGYIQFNELDSFRQANSLLKNSSGASFDETFEQALETQVKEAARNAGDKASEVTDDKTDTKKKKAKENHPDTLPDVTQITRNVDRNSSSEVRNTYLLLDKMKEKKKSVVDDDLTKGPRQRQMENANFAGQPMFDPVYDQGPRQRANKSQMLAAWEKFAPIVTEDVTKKAVRIDIPLINDIQAIVLRMHPDRSITASLLGSYEMGELVKQHKDKLDRNLKHHHLSLREFNAYRSELEFTSESGTKKNKKKPVKSNKQVLDIM